MRWRASSVALVLALAFLAVPSQGVAVGDQSQNVLIGGVSSDQVTEAAGGFLCLVKAAEHSFTVHRSQLSNMPTTGGVANLEEFGGMRVLVTLPNEQLQSLNISGLDASFVVNVSADVRTVAVQ